MQAHAEEMAQLEAEKERLARRIRELEEEAAQEQAAEVWLTNGPIKAGVFCTTGLKGERCTGAMNLGTIDDKRLHASSAPLKAEKADAEKQALLLEVERQTDKARRMADQVSLVTEERDAFQRAYDLHLQKGCMKVR